MHRLALAAVALAGCGEPPLIAKPLPELVAPLPRVVAKGGPLQLPAGESLIWEVHANGIGIGRAELVSDADQVRSRFSTNELASMIAHVRYELATTLDRAAARPRSARETIVVNGETTDAQIVFSGASYTIAGTHRDAPAPVHTMHTALGWVRAWARADAAPASVYVVHDGDLYRIDLATPTRDDVDGKPALRVDGRANALSISLWLSLDAAALPLRIMARAGSLQVSAQLVESH